MSLQRSVAQQNEATLGEIMRVASLLASGSEMVRWLPGLLARQGMSTNGGILVELRSVPEQGGNHFSGKWLTAEREFWMFAVVVSRESGAILEVEDFRDVTQSTIVSASLPGTGKSFGYLALQAHCAVYGG